MRATKLQGAGWLSRMLVISCWLLHLARLVCRVNPATLGRLAWAEAAMMGSAMGVALNSDLLNGV